MHTPTHAQPSKTNPDYDDNNDKKTINCSYVHLLESKRSTEVPEQIST